MFEIEEKIIEWVGRVGSVIQESCSVAKRVRPKERKGVHMKGG